MESSLKYSGITSNTMHTREKFGTLCKRCLKYFFENKKELVSLTKIIQFMLNYTSDMKKIFDLVLILEGMGLITRISKNSLIYTGFRGMTAKLNETIIKISEKKVNQICDYLFFSDDIIIDDKKYVFRTSLFVGLLVSDIISSILLDSSKSLSRNEIEQKLEYYSLQCKELASKSLINDLINLLVSLNFVEKRNEQVERITWIGPDCINTSGITKDHIHLLTNLDQVLKASTQDIVSKENSFFLSLFREIEEKKEKKENLIKIKQEIFKETHDLIEKKNYINDTEKKKIVNENCPVPLHISKFPEKSFAILKSKNWKYNIKKLQIIIGRNSLHKDSFKKKTIKWLVDVDLGSGKRISRQHAVIIYNFIDKIFEIKCLSKKYPIKIDGNIIGYKDKAFPLYEKSFITIGTEAFYFLPAVIKKPEEKEEKEEKKQEDSIIELESNKKFKMEISSQ